MNGTNDDRRSRSLALNAQISEEAAEWFIELRTGGIDDAGRHAFDQWMRTSPEHVRAYLEVAAIWNEASGLDAAKKIDLESVAARAHAAGNVVPFAEREAEGQGAAALAQITATRRVRSWLRPGALAATVVVAMLVATGLWWLETQRFATYATTVGEQRSVRLADGSTIEINSRSQVRVRYTQGERSVELVAGQALFKVAKDPARPFVVRTDDTSVRAVGTQFDVNRKASGTVITVIEGKVAVERSLAQSVEAMEPAARSSTASQIEASVPAPILLSAGEQASVSEPQPVRVNTAAATAWTQGQLVLESVPLAALAEEFNRYSERKLIVEDLGSTPLRLSGVFETDPRFLIDYLRARPDITVHESELEVKIVRRN